MPATLTYPGVYIEEFPSGVRTITGVTVGAKDKNYALWRSIARKT